MLKTLKYWTTLFFFISNGVICSSASATVTDSLLYELQKSKEDTNRINTLIDLASEYLRNNPGKSLDYANQALALSQKIKNDECIAESYLMIGSYHYYTSKFNKAISNFDLAKNKFSYLGDKKGIAICFNNLGGIYLKLGFFEKGLQNFIASAKIFEELGDKEGAASLYNNIAIVCQNQNILTESLIYYNKALRLCNDLNDKKLSSSILHNIGSIYHEKHQYNLAIEYYKKALIIRTGMNDKFGISQTNHALGVVYLALGNNSKAMISFNLAANLKDEIGDLHGKAECLNHIGILKYKENNLSDAKKIFKESLKIGIEVGSLPIRECAYSWLANIDSVNGDYKNALTNYIKYKELSDSILNKEKSHQLTQLRMQFENEKKEKESKLESLFYEKSLQENIIIKNKYIILSLLLGTVLIIVLGIIIVQRVKIKSQKKVIELELDKLRQQLNPHFVFNSLNSIQSFLFKNDKLESNIFLTKLTNLMRLILDSAQRKTISIQEEINCITLYIDIMRIRFKNKIDFVIDVDHNIDTQSIKIPPLFLQPYIENSIFHGLQHNKGNGKIKVELLLVNDHIHCKIEDNGIGRSKAFELKKKYDGNKNKSYGSKINENRLKLINSMYKKQLGLKYTDLTDINNKPVGTRVELDLPIIMN